MERKRAKKTIAKVKNAAMDDLYHRLETKGGQKEVYKIAKRRKRLTRDVMHVRLIKDESGRLLTNEEEIKNKWKKYFEDLMNKKNQRSLRASATENQSMVTDINIMEVKRGLNKMKNGKPTGPDEIPVEVWKILGEEEIDILWRLFKAIFATEKMPNEWRGSVLVLIFKQKGDVQDCRNLRS
ncbi:hypothetical protein Y1Q_0021660 [Alligator mississippiensis]|uniref:Reverse transcriptase domain-containing protein n=1 Tax=Alligator mississippiensis TaxID=8496 RepID=A0A151PAU5_ALLMI|nr:hypothetical protein Y1Q_0021660 [Alligator mississippiensis]